MDIKTQFSGLVAGLATGLAVWVGSRLCHVFISRLCGAFGSKLSNVFV
jgi:hypothetical protein